MRLRRRRAGAERADGYSFVGVRPAIARCMVQETHHSSGAGRTQYLGLPPSARKFVASVFGPHCLRHDDSASHRRGGEKVVESRRDGGW